MFIVSNRNIKIILKVKEEDRYRGRKRAEGRRQNFWGLWYFRYLIKLSISQFATQGRCLTTSHSFLRPLICASCLNQKYAWESSGNLFQNILARVPVLRSPDSECPGGPWTGGFWKNLPRGSGSSTHPVWKFHGVLDDSLRYWRKNTRTSNFIFYHLP